VVALIGTIALIGIFALRKHVAGISRLGVELVLIPPVGSLFHFYSLAMHMYVALGEWP
jgi:hypothetical protein